MLICGGVSLHLCINSMFFIPAKNIAKHPFNIWKSYDPAVAESQQNKHKTINAISNLELKLYIEPRSPLTSNT